MAEVTFEINGDSYSVSSDVSSETTLLEYIRRRVGICGTKYMCLKGGCGACIVSVKKTSSGTAQAINSCMVPIASCQDWSIKTIEGIGNRLDGYHKLQQDLAKNNGSQCGYCSPGMIMNMYSLLQSKTPTMLEIEKNLGSNICRCTGYRPILDAFKAFGSDAPQPTKLLDIEDLKICEKTGKECVPKKCEHSDWCMVTKNELLSEVAHMTLSDGKAWYQATTVADIFTVFESKGTDDYMLINGSTAKGVYELDEYPSVIIDISRVSELKEYYVDQNLVIGGGVTITELMAICETVSATDGFSYLTKVNEHLELVAHPSIRNLATVAGNLFVRNQYPSNASDLFVILETLGAQITLMSDSSTKTEFTTQAFLSEDMTGKVITGIILPPLSSEYQYASYKIMPRAQAFRAAVNFGILVKLDDSNIVTECRIVFSGCSSSFCRAYKTETYLTNKELFLNDTLQGALEVLNTEMVVVESTPSFTAEYRRKLALGLFYKALLSFCPSDIVGSKYASGSIQFKDTRPVSEAHQEYTTNPNLWPLNKPIPKIDGLIQCAGEAKYTDDIPVMPGELYAAFVLSTVARGTIVSMDATKALKETGVVAFYTASDLPGVNTFIPAPDIFNTDLEEALCSGKVKYYDQPIGVIVATSQTLAFKAAALVEVTYTDVEDPVTDIKVAKTDSSRTTTYSTITATSKGTDVQTVLSGNFTIYGQYHLPMENIACLVYPSEDGLTMHVSSQWINSVHQATSRALAMDQNKITCHVTRLGGAYGFKLTRSTQLAVAAALAATKQNRPVRFVNTVEYNMRSLGKRWPCSFDYEVGVDATGKIQYLNGKMFGDNGCDINEPILAMGADCYFGCYTEKYWNYEFINTKTDTPSNTWCRAPGTLEACANAEWVIERIACELGLDPLEVRLTNLDPSFANNLIEMTKTLKGNCNYDERKAKVEKYNKIHRWKKRAIRFSFLKWMPIGYQNMPILVSVCSDDGTVFITHGGVEMGQGVNTQAIQVCAYMLNLPVEKIQVKPSNTVNAPNCSASGGSTTSQNISIVMRQACDELLSRLAPIKSTMDNPTWAELIKEAYSQQVDLQVHAYSTMSDMQTYSIYGLACCEAEIDCLTGQHQIIQVDILQDVGQSFNPALDIGQIEGGFLMGQGYWTTERLMFDSSSGQLIVHSPWEYPAPQALDIPQILRVYLRERSYTNDKIFGSKVVGEPAVCLSVVVAIALRAAIMEARVDAGKSATEWFELDGPYTIEKVCLATASSLEEFKYN